MHVLGYFVDHTDPAFRERLDLLRDARSRRARQIVASLESAGYEVTIDDVLRIAEDGSVGRRTSRARWSTRPRDHGP